MPSLWTPERLFRLPLFGADLPWRPHAGRARDLGFAGLDNPEERPLRSRFFRLLRPLGLAPVSGLSREEMLEYYRETRIVPNESIAFEVNLRLAEAACAGACVLSPDVGPDQDEQYAPDQEILVYENGQDLVEKLGFLLRRPDRAEKIGRAAWEKTQARHLARHRAQTVLEKAAGLSPGPRDPVHLAMALAQRGRHLRMPAPDSLLRAMDLPERPEVYALFLRCLSEFFPGEATERAMRHALALPLQGEGRDETGFAVMGHALKQGDLPLFSLAWFARKPADSREPPPVSLYQAALLLAECLRGRGRNFQPGMPFRPTDMVPETAVEALLIARRYAGNDGEWARRMALLCSRSKGMLPLRLDALRVLLERGASWRVLLEYGLDCLAACDNSAGLDAVQRALREAGEQGKERLARDILKKRAGNRAGAAQGERI
jgi:hypothetical protein